MRANQQRRLSEVDDKQHWDDSALAAPEKGLVISRFGQHADVEMSNGEVLRCGLRRAIDSLVTGDEVVVRRMLRADLGAAAVVEAVEPRRSVLRRPDYYDGLKPVAANIDQIFVVSSVLPAFSTQIIDRYLVAAEMMEMAPVIVLNKIDLLTDELRQLIEPCLRTYRSLGYQVLEVSAQAADGLRPLETQLNNRISIFVGQSGVGKSSLINALLPHVDEQIGDVSENSGLGQHTTTTSKLLHLPCGGRLIDSPGVREFALWHLEPEQVLSGFRELKALAGECKFRDCKHKHDPGCAVVAALERGEISADRYQNYQRILETMETDKPKRRFNHDSL